jgi:hypothetical protein
MRITGSTFGMTGRTTEAPNLPGGARFRIQALAEVGLIAMAAILFSGCPTGPGSTTNTTPPTPSLSLVDQTADGALDSIVPAGNVITVFINPGDNYMATFHATSSSGIKSITLSGSGEVICQNNQPSVTSAANSLKVSTCAVGLASTGPSISCP